MGLHRRPKPEGLLQLVNYCPIAGFVGRSGASWCFAGTTKINLRSTRCSTGNKQRVLSIVHSFYALSFGLEGCTGMSKHCLSSFWLSNVLFIGDRCMCENEMRSMWKVLVVSFLISCSTHSKQYYTTSIRVLNNWHASLENCPMSSG